MNKPTDTRIGLCITIGILGIIGISLCPYTQTEKIEAESNGVEVIREDDGKVLITLQDDQDEAPKKKVVKNEYSDKIDKACKKYSVDCDWIYKESVSNGINPILILGTLYNESKMNPKARNSKGNSAGVDRGIAMFNSVYKAYVSDQCSYDWRCSVKQMIKEVKAGKIRHWYGARPLLAENIKVKI